MNTTASATTTTTRIGTALTIAGSDSGGGAGIQADLKAFSARGVYAASVITAITAQNTCAVTAVHAVPLDVIDAQIAAVLDDIRINAIKIGMLGDAGTVAGVTQHLTRRTPLPPIVLDPVMVAKSGDRLLAESATTVLSEQLCPLADLVTPNAPEAAMLLGFEEAADEAGLTQQGEQLAERYNAAILMKGGHLSGDTCTDVLIDANGSVHRFNSLRIQTRNTHGTGCTLSSSITAELAKGRTLTDAVGISIDSVHKAIRAADQLKVGNGHGPVHHFHALWQDASAAS